VPNEAFTPNISCKPRIDASAVFAVCRPAAIVGIVHLIALSVTEGRERQAAPRFGAPLTQVLRAYLTTTAGGGIKALGFDNVSISASPGA
jgi:hypothetical protein